jgi:hypothetical protein
VSSSYSKLNCWAPPTPFFLVNSTVRQDALQVFFSQNRIVVWPTNTMKLPDIVLQSPSRLHVSVFLHDVVPKDALRHLRYLDVVFERFGHPGHLTWCPHSSPELMDWKRTIGKIKPHLASASLAIAIVFPPDPIYIYFDDPDDPDGLNRLRMYSKEEFRHRKTCYFNTVLPLQQLAGGLKHLWVSISGDVEQPGRGAKYTSEWSRELVSTIMGPSYEPPHRYDFESDELPVPLLPRIGRWLLDLRSFY